MNLPKVSASVAYIDAAPGPAQVLVYPPNSGRENVRPAALRRQVDICDARPLAGRLSLDAEGFEWHSGPSQFRDYFDDQAVRERYYPEVRDYMMKLTGAIDVIVFDHNVRSAARSARGEVGVRTPVDQVHNDYTRQSGPRRKLEILAAAGRAELSDRRVAFVNLWRPIAGPVHDNPLALCDARSLGPDDLVETNIHHFGEDNLQVPRHSGQIYSVRANASHRWYYVSALRPDEFLLLKNFDSMEDGRARFMPHTGFSNPACPKEFIPRESIEARTLVVFDEVIN